MSVSMTILLTIFVRDGTKWNNLTMCYYTYT